MCNTLQAVDEKRKAEDISSVLYPNDATEYGKELRLKQQFFFVSASIQVCSPPMRLVSCSHVLFIQSDADPQSACHVNITLLHAESLVSIVRNCSCGRHAAAPCS